MNFTTEAQTLFNLTLEAIEANFTAEQFSNNSLSSPLENAGFPTISSVAHLGDNETEIVTVITPGSNETANASIYFIEPHPDPKIAACANIVLKTDLKVRLGRRKSL